MLITRISGCKGKTFLLNRKDLDEDKILILIKGEWT